MFKIHFISLFPFWLLSHQRLNLSCWTFIKCFFNIQGVCSFDVFKQKHFLPTTTPLKPYPHLSSSWTCVQTVWPDWEKFLSTNFLKKKPKWMVTFWAIVKAYFFKKTEPLGPATYYKNLGNFRFHHLVTLPKSRFCHYCRCQYCYNWNVCRPKALAQVSASELSTIRTFLWRGC